MRRLRHSEAFGIGFAVAAILYAAFAYFPACRGDNCTIQGWLSALSGWVAAAAAIVTLIVLFDQVRSQNRQIKFMLGENPPVAEHWKSNENLATIRITNWNRTKFVITAIHIDAPIKAELSAIDTRTRDLLPYYPIMKSQMRIGVDGLISPPIIVEGWENQNDVPKEIFIDLEFRTAAKIVPKNEKKLSNIRFFGHLSGFRRDDININVEIPISVLIPS